MSHPSPPVLMHQTGNLSYSQQSAQCCPRPLLLAPAAPVIASMSTTTLGMLPGLPSRILLLPGGVARAIPAALLPAAAVPASLLLAIAVPAALLLAAAAAALLATTIAVPTDQLPTAVAVANAGSQLPAAAFAGTLLPGSAEACMCSITYICVFLLACLFSRKCALDCSTGLQLPNCYK